MTDRRNRLPLLVWCCGVCGRGFPDEPGEVAIRAHTHARDEHGEQHDGEPWTGKTLNPGDEFVWAPHVPHGFEACRFVGFDGMGRVYVVSRVRPWQGEVWVDPHLFAEQVFPGDRHTDAKPCSVVGQTEAAALVAALEAAPKREVT